MQLSTLLATTWYPVTFDSPMNMARGIFFWLTVALAIGFAVCAFVLKDNVRKTFFRYSLFGGVGYACIVGIVLLAFTFDKDGITLILFLPLFLLLLAIAGSAVAIALKPGKLTYIIAACAVGATAVASLICMGVYFSTGKPAEDNWLTNADVDQIGLYVSSALLVIAIIVATLLLGAKETKGFDSKSIAYAAICIAMSFALSYLRLVKMPQGGSITIASLLPLMIYSYMFGVKKGVFAGMICGLLQAVQDPIILHPAQFLLDYPVPYACIGFAGVFAKVKSLDKLPQVQIALGGLLAGIMRFICHYFSGVFAFGTFGGEQSAWLYSLTYQSAYVLPDIAIAIAVAAVLFCSPTVVKMARRFRTKSDTVKEVPAEE